jgi:competence protein ComEC
MKAKRNTRIILILIIGITSAFILTIQSRSATTTVTASYINVGEGDSILLRDGNGFDVLIDGGRPGQGAVVAAYLRSQGVNDIDVMVSSHPDSDHLSGLIDVLNMTDIPVLAVVYGGYEGDTATWDNFGTAVANEGLIMTPAQFPDTFIWGDMTVNVLNPDSGLVNPDTNNASVVLMVMHGEVKFLFTGDIEAKQEATIVARGTSISADVLKVAHHGSDGSTSAGFLAAVDPSDAFISVGPNSYGHPGADALARLAAAGARIWRTDECGTIVITSDGTNYANSCAGITYSVFFPLVVRQEAVQPPAADLRITTLSGTTTPEYVTIQNFGTGAQELTGWALVSVVGPQTFTFPAGYVLDPGATVRIESYTGAVNNPPGVLLWNNSAIWANTGHKAELRDAGNGLVSSMCYGSGCP